MTAPGALTEHDVAAVRDDAATDKPVTVWFTAAAVGVPVGGSARVVTVGDTADGDFIQVRPAGSRDTMYCSPNELTRTRPARRRSAEAAEKLGKPTPPAAAEPAGRSASPSAAKAAQAVSSPAPATPVPPPAVPAGPRRRVGRTGEISVCLKATADGEWTVEVLAGKERVVAAIAVQASDVATAARSLPPAVAEAIESSLEGARQRQRDRVEQLRAELDAAQRVLDHLGA